MRNIIVVSSDSIKVDHCSCCGYSREITPFIDSMANKEVRFENPIVSAVTTPLSFTGIFTGEHAPIGQIVNP